MGNFHIFFSFDLIRVGVKKFYGEKKILKIHWGVADPASWKWALKRVGSALWWPIYAKLKVFHLESITILMVSKMSHLSFDSVQRLLRGATSKFYTIKMGPHYNRLDLSFELSWVKMVCTKIKGMVNGSFDISLIHSSIEVVVSTDPFSRLLTAVFKFDYNQTKWRVSKMK